jgi:Tfp pilus assembly protein PilX
VSFRSERGIALPIALGFTMVISIALVTTLELSRSGQRSSNFSRADRTAFSVAEAGLDHAQALLSESSTPTSAAVLPDSCAASPMVTTEGGSFCYWGSLSGNTWTINARSTVSNPGGGSPLTHDVSEQTVVTVPTSTTADNPAWNYLYSDSPTGCMAITSSVTIKQKVYARGDLCLDSSARILSEAQEVSVGGRITTNSSASIGTSASPLATLNIGASSPGCKKGTYGGSGYAYPCTSSHSVYATSQNHSVPPVTKPPIDLAYWYANAKPGPSHPCTTATGTPPVFDTNGVMDNTSSTVNLIGSAYSCSVAGGGSISWMPGSPGTLTLSDDVTMFVDGDITMNGSTRARIVGRGTIYTSGRIRLDSSTQICAVFSGSGCNVAAGAWDPDVAMLIMVAGSGTPGLPSDTYSIELNSSVQWQGGLYAVGDYLQTSSVIAQGPVIARQIYYDSSTGTVSAPFDDLTPGAPSDSAGVATFEPVEGSWRG